MGFERNDNVKCEEDVVEKIGVKYEEETVEEDAAEGQWHARDAGLEEQTVDAVLEEQAVDAGLEEHAVNAGLEEQAVDAVLEE